jgi:hypothetical protein
MTTGIFEAQPGSPYSADTFTQSKEHFKQLDLGITSAHAPTPEELEPEHCYTEQVDGYKCAVRIMFSSEEGVDMRCTQYNVDAPRRNSEAKLLEV